MRMMRTGLTSLIAVIMVAVMANQAQADPRTVVVTLLGGARYSPGSAAASPATWIGDFECVRDCEGVPGGATFTLEAAPTSSSSATPCIPRTAIGDLTITWDDGSTTTLTDVAARSHGTKELSFSGQIDRSSSLFPNAKINGTVGYPESTSKGTAGCLAEGAPVSGKVKLFPRDNLGSG
jgi:hypothetical protein